MRRSAFVLAVVGLSVLGSILLVAQGQQAPPVFRTQIGIVPLDVRVIDRTGRPVTDLTQKDFLVFEDHVRQTIVHFSRDVLTARAADPAERPELRKAPSPQIASQNQRIFLLVLGRGRLQVPSKGVDGAIKFVREDLLPQDLVSVFAYNRATPFTTDRGQLAQVLENFKEHHESIEARLSLMLSGLAAIYGRYSIPSELQREIDGIFAPAGPAKTVPPGRLGDAAALLQGSRDPADVLLNAVVGLNFDAYIRNQVETIQDMANLSAGIEYLRWLEGEKHIVFLTERGLYFPTVENDTCLAAHASDARVAIDTIQTGGLVARASSGLISRSNRLVQTPGLDDGIASSRNPPGWNPAVAMPINMPGPGIADSNAVRSLMNISRLTGGLSSADQNAGKALARINEVTKAEYLIGYSPTDTNWDGRYRRVDVRVNRPGVTVLFRHGYYGSPVVVPADSKAFVTYRRVAAAAQYPREVPDIKLRATAEVVRNQARVATATVVDMSIDVSRVAFTVGAEAAKGQPEDTALAGRHIGAVDVSAYVVDGRDRVLGELRQTLEMKLKDETYQKAMKDGVPFTMRVPVRGEPRRVKVIVYNYDSDVLGSTVVDLR